MDSKEFREKGKEMVDFIGDYMDNIESRRVNPDITPGFLVNQLPASAPEQGENFTQIMEDFNSQIMPGICHWNSPHFHSYYPVGWSFPSVLGEMMSAAIGGVGFTWASNPSYTELEIVVLDWLGKMLGLPAEFLAMNADPRNDGKRGGGVIQGSASDSVLVAMLTAREAAIDRLKQCHPDESHAVLMGKLVAYSARVAHSSIEKGAKISGIQIRLLETDDQGALQAEKLEIAVKADKAAGLFPFFLCGTLGSTAVCSFDNLPDLGPICKRENMWLHVDAAYAGAFFVCPEFRSYLKGVEFADSFNLNAHKMLLTNFDCSPFWVRDREALFDALSIDRSYFKDDSTGIVTDFRNWQIPLGRRFRALKLWFVLRSYGVEGMQTFVREHIRLTKLFESFVLQDDRFEFWPNPCNLGLVCFRLKGPDELSKMLVDDINNKGKISLTSATFKNRSVIRYYSRVGKERHTREAWGVIKSATDALMITNSKL